MTITKGTKCRPSVRGHYNFYYPDTNQEYELSMSIEVNRLSWTGYDGYKAFEIMSPKDYLPMKVLWIKLN